MTSTPVPSEDSKALDIRLSAKIADRSAAVAVVGLGYVGLPMAVAFAEAGFQVVGVDRDRDRLRTLAEGRSHIDDVPSAVIARIVETGMFRLADRCSTAGELDVITVAVPTPLDRERQPDLTSVHEVVGDLAHALTPGQLIVLGSTTYPGTTEELLSPLAERAGLAIGVDLFCAFAPERIDPGNREHTMYSTPKTVGGLTPQCTLLAAEFLSTICSRVVPASSAAAAETSKLLENTFRSVNVGLANEMAVICRRLGLDVWEVVDLAATKPYGFMPFYPGPGIGGHCIPIDPTYLTWSVRQRGYIPQLIEAADEVNRSMPVYAADRIAELLEGSARPGSGASVLLLGMAYKPNVADTRESPAVIVAELLMARGIHVQYCDPHVPSLVLGGETIARSHLTRATLETHQLVVVLTDHETFDWNLVRSHAKLVFDTRGTRHGADRHNWVRL